MSRVEVDLESVPGGTKISIAHFDIPEGQEEQYKRGWRTNYLDPMKKFFSKPGAMRSAIKAASKARRLPIPGVNSAPPGSVRPPEGPRIKTQQKTAKSAAKHAAAKRAGVGKSSAATQTGKQTAKKSAKSAAKKTAKNKPLKRTAKKPAKKVTKRTEKKAAPKRAAKKKTAKKKPKR
jgi:hypothetical protein